MRAVGKLTGTVYDLHPIELIGRGGEARVYRKGGVCVKVHDTPPTEAECETIEVLARLGRSIECFAWPIELVCDPRTHEPVGFTMPFVPGTSLEAALDARETAGWGIATKVLCYIDITKGVRNVHELVGTTMALGDDIKPGNILFDGRYATFIDTAAISVFGFRTKDGSVTNSVNALSSPGYVPPEVLHNPSAIPSHAADRFALAVTLFEVIYGRSPTEPKPCPAAIGLNPDDAVRDGLFLKWVTHPEFDPPSYDPVPVPDEIDAHFRTAFLGRPDQRPPATEWLDALVNWWKDVRPAPAPTPAASVEPKRRRWLPIYRAADTAISAGLFVAAALLVGRWALTEFKRPPEAPPAKESKALPTTDTGPPLFKEIFK